MYIEYLYIKPYTYGNVLYNTLIESLAVWTTCEYGHKLLCWLHKLLQERCSGQVRALTTLSNSQLCQDARDVKNANASKRRAVPHSLMRHCTVLEAASIPTFIAEHRNHRMAQKGTNPSRCVIRGKKREIFLWGDLQGVRCPATRPAGLFLWWDWSFR